MHMFRSPVRRGLAVLAILAVAGCSGGTLPTATPAPTPPPATAAHTPPPASAAVSAAPSAQAAGGAVSSLDAVQTATIQIEATGTYVDPQVGQQSNAGWSGSGFFIDPSGLAITNNHVVTGAAFLKVWIGGDQNKVYNAQVLGASECSDIALIKVVGVDKVPYLKWYTQAVHSGLDVYAAGFPLGDPEYTLKRGIISKEKANGETSWASVDSVIEHDAATLPGNSGGPLVTADGQVIGVNFASDDAGERFAITEGEVNRILPDLENGKDVTSIGVNGEAVADQTSGISGIWVSSVKSGSPADKVGVKPGDIITRLEDLVLATDGTKADYCRILRSHAEGSPLSIQVLRYATQQILEGELNGRELTEVTSFAQGGNNGGSSNGGSSNGGSTSGYSGYTTVKDDSGIVSIEAPNEWSDTSGGSWTPTFDKSAKGVGITVSADIAKYQDTWTEPGVFIGVSRQVPKSFTVDKLLDTVSFKDSCTYEDRSDYQDQALTGKYDYYSKCDGGKGGDFIVLAAMPADESYMVFVEVLVMSDADLEAADHIVQSFTVLGNLP